MVFLICFSLETNNILRNLYIIYSQISLEIPGLAVLCLEPLMKKNCEDIIFLMAV